MGGAVLAAEVRAIYRHLLRTTSHAVRHEKPVYKNLRRLLREDVRDSLAKCGGDAEHFHERAAMTYLMHLRSLQSGTVAVDRARLSAAKKLSSPSPPPSARSLPVHRLMLNISSLSYHHLSPHTVLQPSTKRTRIGGSDARAQRRSRQRVLDAHRTIGDEDDEPVEKLTHSLLPSLFVMGSRPRGPLTGSSVVRMMSANQRWNGQRKDSLQSLSSEAGIRAKVEEVNTMAEEMIEARERSQLPGASLADTKLYAELYKQLKETKGALKSMTKSFAQKAERHRHLLSGARMLNGLVQQVEKDTGAFIGGRRMQRWADDEWLEPN